MEGAQVSTSLPGGKLPTSQVPCMKEIEKNFSFAKPFRFGGTPTITTPTVVQKTQPCKDQMIWFKYSVIQEVNLDSSVSLNCLEQHYLKKLLSSMTKVFFLQSALSNMEATMHV